MTTTKDEARAALLITFEERKKAIRHFLKVHRGICDRTFRYRDRDYDD
jgi:hypothetical protein